VPDIQLHSYTLCFLLLIIFCVGVGLLFTSSIHSKKLQYEYWNETIFISSSIVIGTIILWNWDIEAYKAIWVRHRTHPTPPSIRGRLERDDHLCLVLTTTKWTAVPCGEHRVRHVEEGSAWVKQRDRVWVKCEDAFEDDMPLYRLVATVSWRKAEF
jgi:hypothetical protein